MPFTGKIMRKMVSTESNYPLTKEQLDFYWNNGYFILKELFNSKQLQLFRDRFKQICNDYENSKRFVTIIKEPKLCETNTDPENYINKIQELLNDEVFMQYSEDGRLLDIVSQLIGDDVTAVNCMLINKPPGTQRHPPHQDLYYFPFRPSHKIVGVWTAIDHVYKDNGCLFVVPQSHIKEILYDHGNITNDKKYFYHGILSEELAAPEQSRVHLEMSPGDTVFFHPYLVHGSGPNLTKKHRKSITAHYANSGCVYIDVKGTKQQPIAESFERELLRRGQNCTFVDLWKLKSKQVKGVKCNL